MSNSDKFIKKIKDKPEDFFIIHYSSQSLYEPEEGNHSPRITSIVVMHYDSEQTNSFSIHTSAEILDISDKDIENKYDEIESKLLENFFDFVRSHTSSNWVHWNMKSITYGFEHLEHRYRVLNKKEPPIIPINSRINLSDILYDKYGDNYAKNPKMLSLIKINDYKSPALMSGEEEAEAFKQKQFIRMNTSTISKVSFFKFVIHKMIKGKLKNEGKSFLILIDKALESRWARVLAFFGASIGVPISIYQGFLWLS